MIDLDHPLKVCFPYGGKYFAAIWWTNNRQNSVILSKSLKSLEKVMIIRLNKHSDFELKKIIEIEIVSPPTDLCEKAKRVLFQQTVDDFLQLVQSELMLLNNKFSDFQTPKMFEKCDRIQDEYHFDCEKCDSRFFILKNLSKEDFYKKYHGEFEKIIKENTPSKNYKSIDYQSPYKFSVADIADSSKDLYEISLGHGFGSGVEFRKTSLNEWINTNPVLFYCHLNSELDISIYKEKFEKIVDSKNEKEKLFWKKEENKRLNKDKIKKDLIMKLFDD